MMKISGRVSNRETSAPLSNVAVSNGESTVHTDDAGHYLIEAEPSLHRILRLTTPAGFTGAETPHTLIDELEPLSPTHDFSLEPNPESLREDFTVLQVTDLHLEVDGGAYGVDEAHAREHLLALIREVKPDLLVATGDLTERGSPKSLRLYRALADSLPIPVFSVFGGHDGIVERDSGHHPQPYVQHFEAAVAPTQYSFDWGRTHFIVFHNEKGSYDRQERERRNQWLDQELASCETGQNRIVLLHAEPSPELCATLCRHRVDLVLHGHWHSSKLHRIAGTLFAATPSSCFGGIDTLPSGGRCIMVRAGEVTTRLHFRGKVGEEGGTAPDSIQLSDSVFLKKGWERQLRSVLHRAAPVTQDGHLIVSLLDENNGHEAGLLCLNAATGLSDWQMATDASIKNSVAIVDDTVYAVSVTGRLYALNLNDGRVRWQIDLPEYPHRWIFSSPAVNGDRICVSSFMGASVHSTLTGEMIWHRHLTALDWTESLGDWTAPYASPLPCGDRFILTLPENGYHALHCESGAPLWQLPTMIPCTTPTPLLHGDVMIAFLAGNVLARINVETGEVITRRELPVHHPFSLARYGNRIMVTAADTGLNILDATSLVPVGHQTVGPDLMDMALYRFDTATALSSPAIYEETLLLGSNDGILTVIGADGEVVGRHEFGSPLSAPIAVADGRAILSTFDGRLISYSV
ncbi:MAG: outer membrane protein assembly factor BamB family protein [Planctomycetota bacterium]|jgi:outer membrane protein assembly factor BamB/predicted MPP superfamily phosphohydrolase